MTIDVSFVVLFGVSVHYKLVPYYRSTDLIS